MDDELVAQLRVDDCPDERQVELALDEVARVEETGDRGEDSVGAEVVEGGRGDDHVALLYFVVLVYLRQHCREQHLLVLVQQVFEAGLLRYFELIFHDHDDSLE